VKTTLTLAILFSVVFYSQAQINLINPNNKSITILPKGIIDSRVLDPVANTRYVAIGDSAFASTSTGGDAVVAIGHKAMAKSLNVGYSVAVGDRAMYNSTNGYANVAIGASTLYNNQGYNNTAIGFQTMSQNLTGTNNTALGANSISNNINGEFNIGIGSGSLRNNRSASRNIAIGSSALGQFSFFGSNIGNNINETNLISIGHNSSQNFQSGLGYSQGNVIIGNDAFSMAISGSDNTTMGHLSLSKANTTSSNTAVGFLTLYNLLSVPGNLSLENSAMGSYSMSELIRGSYNTAVGVASANSLVFGSNNTFLGRSAGVTNITSGTSVDNSMALGNNAKVNASNKVVIGNGAVSSIGGNGAWVNYSDRRLKENIVYTNKLGLNFINSLNTASYNYISDNNKRRRDGLIAQDVQAVLKNLGLEFSGLIEDNDSTKTLNISYGELVMPLINAVKELSEENKKLKLELNFLKKDVSEIKAMLNDKKDLN
jgi:trimeric autotransporter adhesin